MSCPKCSLGHQEEFLAEMVVHPHGLKNLDNSGILLFPKLSVCLECGYVQFTVPQNGISAARRYSANCSADDGGSGLTVAVTKSG
jgi:hypothetical protein